MSTQDTPTPPRQRITIEIGERLAGLLGALACFAFSAFFLYQLVHR